MQAESEVVTISGYHDVPQNNEQSFLKALAHQPLSVAIEASGRDFQFYSGVSHNLTLFIYSKLLLWLIRKMTSQYLLSYTYVFRSFSTETLL